MRRVAYSTIVRFLAVARTPIPLHSIRSISTTKPRMIRFVAEFATNPRDVRLHLLQEAQQKHGIPVDVPMSPPPLSHPHRTMYPELTQLPEDGSGATSTYFTSTSTGGTEASGHPRAARRVIPMIPKRPAESQNAASTSSPSGLSSSERPSTDPSSVRSPYESASPFEVATPGAEGGEKVECFNPFGSAAPTPTPTETVPSTPKTTATTPVSKYSPFQGSFPSFITSTSSATSSSISASSRVAVQAQVKSPFGTLPSPVSSGSNAQAASAQDEGNVCPVCHDVFFAYLVLKQHMRVRHPGHAIPPDKPQKGTHRAAHMNDARAYDRAVLQATCALSPPPEVVPLEQSIQSLSAITLVGVVLTILRPDEGASSPTLQFVLSIPFDQPPAGEVDADVIPVRCSHTGDPSVAAMWKDAVREGVHVCVVGQLRMNPQMDAGSSKYYYYPMVYVTAVCGSVTPLDVASSAI